MRASSHSRSTSIRPEPSKGIGNSTFKRNRPAVSVRESSRRKRNRSLALLARSGPSWLKDGAQATWTNRFYAPDPFICAYGRIACLPCLSAFEAAWVHIFPTAEERSEQCDLIFRGGMTMNGILRFHGSCLPAQVLDHNDYRGRSERVDSVPIAHKSSPGDQA